jgi:hypothetical protein
MPVVEVLVPHGAVAGQPLQIQVGAQVVQIDVPTGVRPGTGVSAPCLGPVNPRFRVHVNLLAAIN